MRFNIKTIIDNWWMLRYLFSSIHINFHYLPFRQAIHLPILVYRPKFEHLGGRIIIQTPDGEVKRGMIRLGRHLVSIYGNHGIMIENNGTIIFHGDCELASGTKLSVGEYGVLEFGDKSRASAEVKIICTNSIKVGTDVGIGWETVIMDTDFHQLTTTDGSPMPVPVMPVNIGSQTWIASRCRIMKGTVIPPKCVVASGSMLNRRYDIPECSLLAGAPATVIRNNIWRNRENEEIDYSLYASK